MTATAWHTFVGQNIKGTPQMPKDHVAHDLRRLALDADVLVVQEFKWRPYWSALRKVASSHRWRTKPGLLAGWARPIRGGQVVAWDADKFAKVKTTSLLLHDGMARVSDDRWLRAALLRDRATTMTCWFGTTHFVVGGDSPHDPELRQNLLRHDLARLALFLHRLTKDGQPVVFQLDANVHANTAAFQRLRRLVNSYGGRFYGQLGVEYLFVIPGSSTRVEVRKDFSVPTAELFTDHEGRGLVFRLAAK